MFRTLSLVVAPAALLLATLPGASAHAQVSDIRVPGPAHLLACGKTSFDEVTKDPAGHIEDQQPVPPGCELQLCRGLLFKDQAATAASTVTTTPSGNVTFNVKCTIPHGGPANVKLIDTTTGGTGTVIGDSLKQFDVFCPTTGVTPPDQSTLQVTLPDAATLAGRCSKPGDCVTQLFWATPDGSQNYFYCKDTVVSGGTDTKPLSPSTTPAQGSSSSSGVTTPAGATDIAPPPASTDGTGENESGDQPTDVAPAQPTDVEDPGNAVGSVVGDTATPTDTGDAAVPTDIPPPTGDNGNDGESALQKLIDALKDLFSKKSSQPSKPPVGARRWMKEHY